VLSVLVGFLAVSDMCSCVRPPFDHLEHLTIAAQRLSDSLAAVLDFINSRLKSHRLSPTFLAVPQSYHTGALHLPGQRRAVAHHPAAAPPAVAPAALLAAPPGGGSVVIDVDAPAAGSPAVLLSIDEILSRKKELTEAQLFQLKRDWLLRWGMQGLCNRGLRLSVWSAWNVFSSASCLHLVSGARTLGGVYASDDLIISRRFHIHRHFMCMQAPASLIVGSGCVYSSARIEKVPQVAPHIHSGISGNFLHSGMHRRARHLGTHRLCPEGFHQPFQPLEKPAMVAFLPIRLLFRPKPAHIPRSFPLLLASSSRQIRWARTV
jgi:hypothetical protein